MFKIHEIFGWSVNEVEGKTRFSVKHIFVPWRYLDDCYKILIFGPQNKLTHHPFPLPPHHAFNSHFLWRFIRLKRSHYRKEGKYFLGESHSSCLASSQQPQPRREEELDDNVCRSPGVWMRKGAGSRAPGLPFPCGGAQCSGSFGGHSRAVLQRRDPLAVHLGISSMPSGCSALHHVCHFASLAQRKCDKFARLPN